MSELILDFPCNLPSKSATKKSVRFDSTSQVHLYPQQQSERGDLFYSEHEYQLMIEATKQVIQDLHTKRISAVSSHDIKMQDFLEDYGCHANGIENLLVPNTIKQVVVSKLKCRRAVLLEQSRRRSSGIYDMHKLAYASQRQSEWSVERARVIAMVQTKCIKN